MKNSRFALFTMIVLAAVAFSGSRVAAQQKPSELEAQLRALEPRLRELEPQLREHLRDLEPMLRQFGFDGLMNLDFEGERMVPRTRLGVQVGELPQQLADYFGASHGGVLVSSVNAGSSAEKAGLRAGDVITSVNGGRVSTSSELIAVLRGIEGKEVTLVIVRDKTESTVRATLDDTVRR
ncbi:MAG TPA: PDZ domain-containing protein [Vicinamibacterales bacterium]|nr:PDZ domain-containing protein [Vicinamibacterales bacterium]